MMNNYCTSSTYIQLPVGDHNDNGEGEGDVITGMSVRIVHAVCI